MKIFPAEAAQVVHQLKTFQSVGNRNTNTNTGFKLRCVSPVVEDPIEDLSKKDGAMVTTV
jgi:hypothetical protein